MIKRILLALAALAAGATSAMAYCEWAWEYVWVCNAAGYCQWVYKYVWVCY